MPLGASAGLMALPVRSSGAAQAAAARATLPAAVAAWARAGGVCTSTDHYNPEKDPVIQVRLDCPLQPLVATKSGQSMSKSSGEAAVQLLRAPRRALAVKVL